MNTEKACRASRDSGVYIFKVSISATKLHIKRAIETLFAVSVVSVNVALVKPRYVRFKGDLGKKSAFKKAFVKLASGQHIDIGEILH